jgi:hypothetical protein
MKRLIVLRNCPPLLAYREGWWYDLSRFPKGFDTAKRIPWLGVDFYPTGRLERRDDGAVAEIYEPVEA